MTFLPILLRARQCALSALAASLLALSLTGCSDIANAQGAFWGGPQIGAPVFGDDDDATRARPERKSEPLQDLRPDATPLRSDVMLDAMAAAIEQYEKIVAAGGWPEVPRGRMMRAGDDDPRVPILRKRLRISGDFPAKSQYYNSETFDGELEAAVRRFQLRNGVRPTGRIEQSMYATLNITAQERLDQLRLNYERLRGLMHGGLEDRYILVNTPAFQLEAVERHEVQLRHRVIAGRPERQTPDVRAMIKALNFFPFWRVPDSVAMLDLVPRLQKEPEYVVNEIIRIYDGYNGPEIDPRSIDWYSPQVANYKFKQDPGEKNALGLVRIDMQNEHGVYMHDTPMKKLFDQRSRAFSAGCVRVQEVFQLAEWIARYEMGWEQPGMVQQVLAGGQALDLTLTRPIPVYFTYITAWAEPATGSIEFRPDIYGRDKTGQAAHAWMDPDERPPAGAADALAP